MRKKSLVWILIPVFAAALVSVLAYWDSIALWIAPKYVLRTAVSTAVEQLEERFAQNPILILMDSIDNESKYTADVSITAGNLLLGDVQYQMNIQTDGREHRVLVQGTASTMVSSLELSCYLDSNFLAVSSDQLVNANYYGVTYDSFREDIRSIPLLDFFITEKMIAQWDTQLQNIRQELLETSQLPQVPALSEEELNALLLGLLALPCDMDTVSVADDGVLRNCRTLSYHLDGEQLGASNASSISVTFYLYESQLIKILLTSAESTGKAMAELWLGVDPLKTPLTLKCTNFQNDTLYQTITLAVQTQNAEDFYKESWSYVMAEESDVKQSLQLDFEYQPSSGELLLHSGTSDSTVALVLQRADGGFFAQSDNFSELLRVLNVDSGENGKEVSGTIRVGKGSKIEVPEYINLDQWSLDDLWTLLTGIGALFGISISS